MPEENIQAAPEASEIAVVQPSIAAEDNAPKREHHEHIYDILTKQDEVTWQTIIFELIKSEQMDPWDINVSKLSKLYIAALKKLKEMNLRLSGKVLLAAALLLRIKSTRLVGEDMMEFDRLLASGENPEELYQDENFVQGEMGSMGINISKDQMTLLPRTPQPRKRKVSVYDLIDALAIALNVRRRRILSQIETRTMNAPDKPMDITSLMDGLMEDVIGYLNSDPVGKLAFSKLVPGDAKKDKVYTFIPLLHLTNARKVDLDQKESFGEIWISLADPNAVQEKLDYEIEMERKKDNAAKKPRKPRQKKENTAAPKEINVEAVPTEIQPEAVPEPATENVNPAA